MTDTNENIDNEINNNDIPETVDGGQEQIVDKEPEQEPASKKDSKVDPDEFERTRQALAKANKEAADRRLKLKEWDELGVKPEDVKSLLDAQREAEIKKAEEEGRYQDNIDRIRTDAQAKLEAANQEVEAIKQKLERQIKSKTISEAIVAEDGIPLMLEPHVKDRVKLIENGDEYTTQVVDENGVPMVDEKNNPVSVREFIASLREHPDLKYGFKAPKTSGTGVTGSNTSTKGSVSHKGVRRSKMSEKESRDFVSKHGIKEYKSLPW